MDYLLPIQDKILSLSHIPHTNDAPHATTDIHRFSMVVSPYTFAIRFQSSRAAPPTQLTPSHAYGRRANVINRLRVIPTLFRVVSTISLAQQFSLLIWLIPF